MPDYHRMVLTLDDAQLERFARDWVALKKTEYAEIQLFAGARDLGRDVVGFLTQKRHEGPWHNYQCKQYTRRRLPLGHGLAELGKILYHAHTGAFTPPTGYYFVAPHGIGRGLEQLFDKPSKSAAALIDGWDKYCANNIIANNSVTLDASLTGMIEAYDFSAVTRITLAEMLATNGVSLVLHKHFGADPGPAPVTTPPKNVLDYELVYVSQLVEAYGTRDKAAYRKHSEIASHAEHGPHFRRQRERFFDADGFKRFYRDNTAPETLPGLETELHHGVIETHNRPYDDALSRHDAVMAHAGTLHPSGPLAQHARITVKQGYCHHFANEGKLTWRKI